MRHPGAQYQNRMKTLLEKMQWRIGQHIEAGWEVSAAERKLQEAIDKRDTARFELARYERMLALMSAPNSGFFPWGLPSTVSREDWLALIGEELEGNKPVEKIA